MPKKEKGNKRRTGIQLYIAAILIIGGIVFSAVRWVERVEEASNESVLSLSRVYLKEFADLNEIRITSEIEGIRTQADRPADSSSNLFCDIYTAEGEPVPEMSGKQTGMTNLFESLANSTQWLEGFSLGRVRRDWAEGKAGYTAFETEDLGIIFCYYKPISGTTRVLVTYMRDAVIADLVESSSHKITVYTIHMMVIMVGILICLFAFVLYIIRKEQASQIKSAAERRANRAKTTFLFNMSHDIRTPMNAIIGFTNLARQHIDDRELMTGYLDKIRDSGELLLSLINNVLEIARIESGNERLDETLWNAKEFNDAMIVMFEDQMKEKNIAFIRTMKVKHEFVVCDTLKVREIFQNILSNACKYTPPGGLITMEVMETAGPKAGYAYYKTVITDNGIGMSEDFLPHIFEEFSRERTSTESRVVGTGLGMQIVKKYVDLMEGTIEIESRPDEGTKVTVVLPHRIVSEDAPAQDRKPELPGNEREEAQQNMVPITELSGKRILLAEDNELNAEIAIAILEEMGFLVEQAEDGAVCIDMLRKAGRGYYDLILMDIQMPNMDGYEAARRIRSMSDTEKASIPIVAMTANAFEEDRKNAFAAGMNGHVPKPIDLTILSRAIVEVLGGRDRVEE